MPRIKRIEVGGFRSFGGSQELVFEGPCAVVSGANSQGKTAVAEAVEFLFTGQTIRRELLGGAKAEFDQSLRNVHRDTDCPVWVEADIEDDGGDQHRVRRELISDYTAQDDCTTRLLVDGTEAPDFEGLGFPLADPPLIAPVLLQHSLRFALSARPTDRTEYFKSVVEIADLELFRDAIVSARSEWDAPQDESTIGRLQTCRQVPELTAICADLAGLEQPTVEAVEDRLRDALEVALASSGAREDEIPTSLGDRVSALASVVDDRREQRFPVTALRAARTGHGSETTSPLDREGVTRDYLRTRERIDREADRLRVVFEAVLAVPSLESITEPIDCPVCETPVALTPARIRELRKQIEEGTSIREKRKAAAENLADVARWIQSLRLSPGPDYPAACDWSEEEWDRRSAQVRAFGISEAGTDELQARARSVHTALAAYEERRNSLLGDAQRIQVEGWKPQRSTRSSNSSRSWPTRGAASWHGSKRSHRPQSRSRRPSLKRSIGRRGLPGGAT